jgi:hypothetical protein
MLEAAMPQVCGAQQVNPHSTKYLYELRLAQQLRLQTASGDNNKMMMHQCMQSEQLAMHLDL